MTLDEFSPAEVRATAERLEGEEPGVILRWCWERFGERAAIGTSFQGAGLVVMDISYSAGLRFPVFTLDTGLLFPETLELKRVVEGRFGIVVEALVPEQTVDEQAAEHGPELWKRNPDLCCSLRKVLPLQKKLAELDVWITGLRRDQSDERQKTAVAELYHFDVLRDRYILKLNPLATWTRERVLAHLAERGLPRNPLMERGYRSIGCMPCTRPVGEGDSERAGRWTGFDKSECGIHTFLGASI
jgi:phosphoadenosine phosphosulfate reductase